MNGLFSNLTLFVFSITLCLGASEVTSRVHYTYAARYKGGPVSESYEELKRPAAIRELGYELYPNLAVSIEGTRFTTNSFGLRGAERSTRTQQLELLSFYPFGVKRCIK